MRLLVFDHFFGQDIDALLTVAVGRHDLRVVPYTLLYEMARYSFSDAAFANLEEPLRPEFADARHQQAADARDLLQRIYLSFPFDAIIVPSDTFFYLRPWVDAAHEIGRPFIVVQKETSIAPFTMVEYARHVRDSFPFISDLMLVCSERHKQFWINAGSDPEKIIVTGQPRFDLYCQPEQWKDLSALGVTMAIRRPTLLFFSYDRGAYSPEEIGLAPTWNQLHAETERVLIDAALGGRYNLLIKPHPQQDIVGDAARLQRFAGAEWGRSVQLLDGTIDTRHLIINADLVVGFQTTALYEAMAAGKPTIYTFWTEPTARYVAELLPFHEMDDALSIARSPDELRQLVMNGCGPSTYEQKKRRREVWEEQLGPFDGHATERCLHLIEHFIRGYEGRVSPDVHERRRDLVAKAPDYCRGELLRTLASALVWQAADLLLPIAYPLLRLLRPQRSIEYAEYRAEINRRKRSAREHAHDCGIIVALAARPNTPSQR